MYRPMLRSLILGACALSAATVSLADLPAPAPQRAEGRKAPPATRTPLPTATPLAVTKTPSTSTASARGIIFVGGKSAINSQPVPPGKTGPSPQPIGPGNSAINSQPVPPGKPVNPVGPGPVDPAARKISKSSLSR